MCSLSSLTLPGFSIFFIGHVRSGLGGGGVIVAIKLVSNGPKSLFTTRACAQLILWAWSNSFSGWSKNLDEKLLLKLLLFSPSYLFSFCSETPLGTIYREVPIRLKLYQYTGI